MSDYLEKADVWTILDLIVAEFLSDPSSQACFDKRLVEKAIQLNTIHQLKNVKPPYIVPGD